MDSPGGGRCPPGHPRNITHSYPQHRGAGMAIQQLCGRERSEYRYFMFSSFSMISIGFGVFWSFGVTVFIRILSAILILWTTVAPLGRLGRGKQSGAQNHIFWFIWCTFLLHFLSLFAEFEELYSVRPLFGCSGGDVHWRLFASASPSQFDKTPRSHAKKMQSSTFLKPVGENHRVKYYKH